MIWSNLYQKISLRSLISEVNARNYEILPSNSYNIFYDKRLSY